MANLKTLDPVQGLVDYVLDIKPYHTKIVEVLVEYIHAELVSVEIKETTEFDLSFQFPALPENFINYSCLNGFDTGYFGGDSRILVMSPNPTRSFTAYPAINSGTNSFTTNGNVTTDFVPGELIYISSTVENYTNMHNIAGAITGPAPGAAFTVLGDVTSQFVAGYIFDATSAGINNGTYQCSVNSTFDGTYTTVTVYQSVPSATTGGTIGLVTTVDSSNTGWFTIASVDYSGGTIDSLLVPTDPMTITMGNNPHTIITVVENLSTPSVSASESYSSYVTLTPIPITSALSYSRVLGTEPDEGNNRHPITGVTLSIVISGIPTIDSGKITLAGDYGPSNIFVGDAIKVDRSTDNNGTYTISSITYDIGNDETIFGVEELIDSAIVDGYASVRMPANTFMVAGNRTNQFTQGRQFDVHGGVFSQLYTVLRSDYSQGETQIRVIEHIFDLGIGNPVIGTTGGFTLLGNQSLKFPAGVAFNVVGSLQNDGRYVVDVGGTTYNSGTDTSLVPVTDTIDSDISGELYLALHGAFKRHAYGYDVQSPICSMVPETVVAVYINETLTISGAPDGGGGEGIDLMDTVDYTILDTTHMAIDISRIGAFESIIGDSIELANELLGFPNGNVATTTAQASFTDTLMFGWGNEIVNWWQYNLREARPATSELIVVGNSLSHIQSGEEINILGTHVNDGLWTVTSAPTYDSINNLTTVVVAETLNYRLNVVVEFSDVDIVKVLGNAANMMQGGDIIDIIGGSANDGTYTIVGASYVAPYSYIIITTTFPDPLATDGNVQFIERGGWVEPAHTGGIMLHFEDSISFSVTENADATLLLDSGSLIGAWDYNYFDVGSFDENLGTVVHLYSNTF